ncbi:MAG: hypothetical protein JST83_17870 [Bacteroidetes bacterium]|nr:hypothetical protein [Bacteroidota bacterium]
MIEFSTGNYKIQVFIGEEPIVYDIICKAAVLIDDKDLKKSGTAVYLIVSSNKEDKLNYLVGAFCTEYVGIAGFYPAIHLEEQTHTLFVGAGTIIKTYNLLNNKLVFEKDSGLGFWTWYKLGDYIIQKEEIAFGVFNTKGEQLWETFISPPSNFEYTERRLILTDCDQERVLDIATGNNI